MDNKFVIEVVNFDEESFDIPNIVVNQLNNLQDRVHFEMVPYHDVLSASEREVYAEQDFIDSSYLFTLLRYYRLMNKKEDRNIIAIIHKPLSSKGWTNLYGATDRKRGLRAVTTSSSDGPFTPPSPDIFLMYYLIRFSIDYVFDELTSHSETRDCLFDFKQSKLDILGSMREAKICEHCLSTINNFGDRVDYLDSFEKMWELLRTTFKSLETKFN